MTPKDRRGSVPRPGSAPIPAIAPHRPTAAPSRGELPDVEPPDVTAIPVVVGPRKR